MTEKSFQRGVAAGMFSGLAYPKNAVLRDSSDATGKAVRTKGLYSTGNVAHLNLDRSLADVWQTSDRARAASLARWKSRRAEIADQYKKLVPPYAGYDPQEREL